MIIPVNKRWISLVAVLGSLYYGANNFTVDGLNQIRITPKPWAPVEGSNNGMAIGDRMALIQPSLDGRSLYTSLNTSINRSSGTEAAAIRVGTFNLHLFGNDKTNKPHVMESLAKICRKFDVLAIQEISGTEQDLLPLLIQKINQSGRRFDYLIGPRVGKGANKVQLGFLFDTDRVESDRYQLYTVDDPLELLNYEPLVAWFRTKDVSQQEAFTFTAINTLIDSNNVESELRVLPELLESVHRDGRNEDDCLLLGDFGSGDRQLAFLRSSGLEFAVRGIPTSTRGDAMYDNILYPGHATDEYTGRSGALDFLRELNLSIDQALEVSDHLPVWAEFFSNEGGQQGRVAKSTFH